MGVSVQGSLCPGGSLSRGVSVQRSLCPGESLSRGSLSRWVSVQRGLCPEGSLSGKSLSGRPPSLVNRQMPVKILSWVVINFPWVYLALKVMLSVMSVHHSVHGGW